MSGVLVMRTAGIAATGARVKTTGCDRRSHAQRTGRRCLKAAALRGSLSGAVFYPDHGNQYASKDFAHICRELGVTQSMGGVGSSADNALAESFNAALKREVLQDRSSWPDAATCGREVSDGMAGPLQHQTTTLPHPLRQPRHLRKIPTHPLRRPKPRVSGHRPVRIRWTQ